MEQSKALIAILEKIDDLHFGNDTGLELCLKAIRALVQERFGEHSHYLIDLNKIAFTSLDKSFYYVRYPILNIDAFRNGRAQLKMLVQKIADDSKNITNYSSRTTTIKKQDLIIPSDSEFKTVNIVIASPSDTRIERTVLLDKLETKFRRDGFENQCHARIIVEGWESLPTQTGYAQDIIETDLIRNANVIIGIFKHKLGTPVIDQKTKTERAPSGSAEELFYAIRNKELKTPPLGMAYFFIEAPILSVDSISFDEDVSEWKRLKAFKETIANDILYKPYKDELELLEMVCKDLTKNILKYF